MFRNVSLRLSKGVRACFTEIMYTELKSTNLTGTNLAGTPQHFVYIFSFDLVNNRVKEITKGQGHLALKITENWRCLSGTYSC